MLNSTWYWNVYKTIFDQDTCDQLVEDAYENGIAITDKEIGADGEFFESKIINDQSVYQSINEKINLANTECFWNFDYTSLEAIKFVEMNVGHYCDWHLDSSHINKELGESRKHTIIVMLSDPSEFEAEPLAIIGGLPNQDGDWNTHVPLEKGDMLILPACVPYKLNVVQDGLEKLLITHTVGPAWR